MDSKLSTTHLDGTGIVVVSVEGDLDLSSGQPLEEAAAAALDASCSLLLDLSKCSFIDSIGARSLLHAARRLHEIGEEMAIVSTPESPVRKVLSLSGIAVVLAIFDTREEAAAVLASERVRGRRAAE